MLHVGAPRSVLIVALNGEEIGAARTCTSPRKFDLTDRLRAVRTRCA
ncbi:MAG: hypothetical protein U0838_12155 [Chloroflexota bacterium]